MYDFKNFQTQLAQSVEWLKKEFAAIRTGRATVTLLDGVFVEAYGSRMPLNQVATISNEDPRTLKINPFDQSQSSVIEQGIIKADLGVSVLVNDSGIRVIFPELTADRRDNLVKQAKKKSEEAKISIRKHRDEVQNEINQKEKSGEMGEDDKFTAKEKMQSLVDETQKQIDKMMDEKEVEIKS